ncbi:Chromosome partition protein Smc [Legionella geestiana]|uniref:Chromosome partition protein Smc n=1 Tax=Legionella geestiana TaxID=45065 RepID=A0A0W0TW92_9GAMM|nr:hypothetical protein [Legionella geestiana]KTC99686.1 Chromosome partition protein Smc [Legionella geestiana]QBS13191.1 hypothetical protein E4T54_10810 [Legionella geestiana]STX54287.1 SH3 domain protein [Legionella geestiana]
MTTRLQNVVNSLIETIVAYQLYQTAGNKVPLAHVEEVANPLYAKQGDELAKALAELINSATRKYPDRRPLLVYMATQAVFLKSLTDVQAPLADSTLPYVEQIVFNICMSLAYTVRTVQEEMFIAKCHYPMPHLDLLTRLTAPAGGERETKIRIQQGSSASSSSEAGVYSTFVLKGCDRSNAYAGKNVTVAGEKILLHFYKKAGMRETLFADKEKLAGDIKELQALVHKLCKDHQQTFLIAQKAEALPQIEKERDNLRQAYASLKDKNDADEARIAELMADIAALQQELVRQERENTALREELLQVSEELQQVRQKNSGYREEVERLTTENSRLISEMPRQSMPAGADTGLAGFFRHNLWGAGSRRFVDGLGGLRVVTEPSQTDDAAPEEVSPPSPFYAGFDVQ